MLNPIIRPLLPLLTSLLCACSSDDGSNAQATGGAAANLESGGTATTGGAPGTGGAISASGGTGASIPALGGTDSGGENAGGTTVGGSQAAGGASGGTASGGTSSGGWDTGGATTGATSAGGSNSAGSGGSTTAGSGGSNIAGSGGSSTADSGGSNAGGAAGATTGGVGGDVSGRTSAELIEGLSLGWNLGNSLDAPEGETAWGNPEVTQSLLQAVAASGFDVVRIPVTWSLHMGGGPDYILDAEFLSRVTQVVDFALASGMVAIINLHHDGADAYDGVEWITLNDASGAVTETNNAAVRTRFVAVWSQIANHFGSFGENLLFESLNEIHDGYSDPDPAYYRIINDLNQAFVDTVRASGGNNAQRHLVVPGYNTNIDYTLAGFEPPEDPTPNHLVLAVHYYDPWDFAGAANTGTWGAASPGSDSWGQESFVTDQFDRLKSTYIGAGLPVIIGEYGAVHQAGVEDYRRYYMEYVTKAAVDRGILPIYWDNGSRESGAEAFGLFDRDTNAVLHPSILEAMMRAATGSYTLEEVALPTP